MTATQNITVTVTASGDPVVTLVLTPDDLRGRDQRGNRDAHVCGVQPLLRGGNDGARTPTEPALRHAQRQQTLFFAEGATRSSGSPVTITAVNDNEYTGEQIVDGDGTPRATT